MPANFATIGASGWLPDMTAPLPIINIPLDRPKGVFKPCRWCGGAIGRAEEAPEIVPSRPAARMICEGCGRQTGWLSARALRKAERIAA